MVILPLVTDFLLGRQFQRIFPMYTGFLKISLMVEHDHTSFFSGLMPKESNLLAILVVPIRQYIPSWDIPLVYHV